jgi:hypothetical protein
MVEARLHHSQISGVRQRPKAALSAHVGVGVVAALVACSLLEANLAFLPKRASLLYSSVRPLSRSLARAWVQPEAWPGEFRAKGSASIKLLIRRWPPPVDEANKKSYPKMACVGLLRAPQAMGALHRPG